MHIKNKRGQSTVEYVLLVTAVIAVIIAFTSSTSKSGFQSTLNSALGTVTNDTSDMATRLSASHAASTLAGGGGPGNQDTVNVSI